MPLTEFTPSNKAESAADFPKLKLDHGEKALVACLENPMFEYVHTLRMPRVTKDGQPEYGETQRNDGTTISILKQDFVGRPLCLGDYEKIGDKGVDPDRCPACRESEEGKGVTPPDRRFAMHVIKYATRSGSNYTLIEPFSVQCVIWAFTDRIFNLLTDFVSTWGPLNSYDLQLGPCENKDYQKFDIHVARDAAYAGSMERKQLVAATFRGNRASDLSLFCGRRSTRDWMENDIRQIRNRWRVIDGEPDTVTAQVQAPALAESLASLLDGVPPSVAQAPAPAAVAQPAATPAGDDPFADLFTSPVGTPPGAPPPQQLPPSAPASGLDFSDLLPEDVPSLDPTPSAAAEPPAAEPPAAEPAAAVPAEPPAAAAEPAPDSSQFDSLLAAETE